MSEIQKSKSKLKLTIQALCIVILLLSSEMLFFTYMNKPSFYIIPVIYLILIFLLARKFRFNLFTPKILKKKEILFIIIGLILNIAITYILTSFTGNVSSQKYFDDITNQTNIILLILTMAILFPIIEEYIFRGVLIKIIFGNIQWLGSIISVIIFALMHSPKNFFEFLIFGVSGTIYVYTYNKTNRIEVPIMIHILNNFIATIY